MLLRKPFDLDTLLAIAGRSAAVNLSISTS